MKKYYNLKTAVMVSAMLVGSVAQSATMTKADYNAGKALITADYKAGKVACASMADNTRDICIEEAKGKEKIGLAELKYGYTGKPADQNKVLEVRAQSYYAIAKEKCDDKAGNVKDVCVKEAKSIEIKALVDARMGKQISETRVDGAQEKLDADYTVATEKCDAMSGDAKSSCVAAAKARFNKS